MALFSSLKDLLLGKGQKVTQIDRFNPEQQAMLGSLTSGAQSTSPAAFNYLNSILGDDPASFEAFASPFIQNFQRQVVPGIMDQVGSTAGLRSSFLGQQLGQAMTDLGTNLASQQQQMKQNAMNSFANLSKLGLEPMQQAIVNPARQGLVQSTLPMLAGGFGMGIFNKFFPEKKSE